MMILAGDIGGTKSNLALFNGEDSQHYTHFATYHSSDYPDLQTLIVKYITEHCSGIRIDGGCLAVPGPVIDGICKVTNLPWVISLGDLKRATKIEDLFLINDLVANACSLEILEENSLVTIHEGKKREGNKAVISPGTGLGEAGIVYNEGEWLPFASEGGHCDFGPASEIQLELARYFYNKIGHFSYDRLLSGPGIVNIFEFLTETKQYRIDPNLLEEVAKEGAASISKLALDADSGIFRETMELYLEILGQEVGNVALKFMAVGGLFLGGGIPPKIVPFFKEEKSSFIKGYLNKGRLSALLQEIPVQIILDDKASLKGSSAYVYRMQKI